MDESKFVNLNNRLLWVVGIIQTSTKKICFEVTFERDAEKWKNIIAKHVVPGNCIVTDAWTGYRWIDINDLCYVHAVHNHGHGNFGHGQESTSYIEQVWSKLKYIIKNIYYSIPNSHFILFLREAEFRRNINLLNYQQKWDNLTDVMKYLSNIGINILKMIY